MFSLPLSPPYPPRYPPLPPDPTAWTGLGNPQGGLVFSNAFTGSLEQTHEWTSFMSSNDFCFRACRDGPNAAGYCEHIYDVCEYRLGACDAALKGLRHGYV
jgi:hypothetical protein